MLDFTCKKSGRIITSRNYEHKQKSVESTKHFDEIELVYYEACINKTDARKREIQLKTGFGRGCIKKRIECYLKSRW
jgi:putative endonuclease